MSCEICGRNSCTASFHSTDEQIEFDDVADKIKDRAKEYISHRVNRLDYEEIDGECYVKLEDVDSVIDGYS